MALLPHDTLREIGKYWAGHRLLYTCRALYASWDYTDHLTTERRVNIKDVGLTFPYTERRDAETTVTISCMPSGAYHGKCTAVIRRRDEMDTEIIMYDRGQILTASYFDDMHYHVETIIDGWLCSWSIDGLDDHAVAPAGDVMGTVTISPNEDFNKRAECSAVPYCDHLAIMRNMVTQTGERGKCSMMETVLDWGDHMPGTRY